MSEHPPSRQRPWRLAIVAQRYGEAVSGGAELHARWLAEHLLRLARVEVLTTCAQDYKTWANHYPPGQAEINGVRVRRFPVDAPRDWRAFTRATTDLLTREHSIAEEIDWIRQQGPYSTALLNYLEQNQRHYDAIIFFTYVYATTYFGLPLAPHKAILVPTAHDEPALHLPAYRSLFNLPRVIVYNTATERALVERVTHNGDRPNIIAGIGINVPAGRDAARFRAKFSIEAPFLYYVGRIDESKNVPELWDFFRRFRQQWPAPLKLVLGGSASIPIPSDPDIIPLGFLSETDKFDGLAAATAVVVPSHYESLSMLALEAWLAGRPVLVNGRCAVLKAQCRQSNGGLYYTTYAEFDQVLRRLLTMPALATALGQNGRAFTQSHYNWDLIVQKYHQVLTTHFLPTR